MRVAESHNEPWLPGLSRALDDIDWQAHPWALLGLQVAAVLAASLLLYRWVHALMLRLFPDRTVIGHVIRAAFGPMQLVVPTLLIELVLNLADDGLPHIALARQLDTLLLIAALTFVITHTIGAFGDWMLRHYRLDVVDNLAARSVHTQTRVLVRSASLLIGLIGLSAALMTLPAVRKIGVSLLASAGVAGLAIGLAAKSVLGNLLAGVQIAITQPIRIDDVLIINGEWGRVEEITATYVVIAIWDQRRMIVPLQWFIENPFQNWTRCSADLMGTVFLWLDFGVSLDGLKAEVQRIVEAAPEWDRRVCGVQVTDSDQRAMQVRVLVSSADSGRNFDLRCKVREGLYAWLRREYPEALPRLRLEGEGGAPASPLASPQPG